MKLTLEKTKILLVFCSLNRTFVTILFINNTHHD